MKRWEMLSMMFLGFLSAVFSVLGPVHESWHWLFATLSGQHAVIHWDYTMVDGTVNLATAFAGMFGEVTTWTVVYFLAMHKGFFKTAAYLHGYIASFLFVAIFYYIGVFPVADLAVATQNYGSGITNVVYGIFNLYLLCAVIVEFYGLNYITSNKILLKGAQNRIKEAENSINTGKKEYPMLTLVK